MGVDVRDIDMVVHIGCPKSVLSYWQEAWRCARDGRQGYALIIYDNFTLSMKSTNKNISDIIKNIDKKCIKQQIIDVLTVAIESFCKQMNAVAALKVLAYVVLASVVLSVQRGVHAQTEGRSTSTNFYNLKVCDIFIQWFDMNLSNYYLESIHGGTLG